MVAGRSFQFNRAIVRKPSLSVTDGLRDGGGPNPDADLFLRQHQFYVEKLKEAGAKVTELPALEQFPDSVFVEDAAICLKEAAIITRPGAKSRFGEAELMRQALVEEFPRVIDLPGTGHLDGGDVLLFDQDAFIGLSARTNQAGFDALATVLAEFGYHAKLVNTPSDILHFKTECGLLDSSTVFATAKLAVTGCFDGYTIIEVPPGEEPAANIVRFNDVVLLSAGYPKSEALLRKNGFNPVIVDTSEAAKVDGGLSCMSLRY